MIAYGGSRTEREIDIMSTGSSHCSKCSSTLRAAAKYCANCGAPIEGQPHRGLTLYLIAAIMSLAIYFPFRHLVTPYGSAADHAGHDHAQAQTASGHATMSESEMSHLGELKKASEKGDPVAILAYVEHLIKISNQYPELLKQALDPLKSLTQQYPNHALSLKMLGDLCFDLNQPKDAINAYRQYLKLRPDDANVWTDMGTQYFYSDQPQAAIDAYQQAISHFPDHYNAHFNLHLVYNSLNQTEQGQTYRAKAEEIEARVGKAMAPSLPQERSFGEAVDGYQQLRAYFMQHEIMGPKFVRMLQDTDRVEVVLRDFPIDMMPPHARLKFDENINQQLDQLETRPSLLILDAQTGSTIASY